MSEIPDWITAFGSILALGAAVAVVALQSRELREQRNELVLQREELARTVAIHEHASNIDQLHRYRSMQLTLFQIAMSDPDILELSRVPNRSKKATKQVLYWQAWLRLMHVQFAIGTVDEGALRRELSDWFVPKDTFRTAWSESQSGWQAAINLSGTERFVQLVSDEIEQYERLRRR